MANKNLPAKPIKKPLASFSLALGDDNGNGKLDIAVDVHAFGAHIADVTKDIDFATGVGLFKALMGLVQKVLPALRIFG